MYLDDMFKSEIMIARFSLVQLVNVENLKRS